MNGSTDGYPMGDRMKNELIDRSMMENMDRSVDGWINGGLIDDVWVDERVNGSINGSADD